MRNLPAAVAVVHDTPDGVEHKKGEK